MVKKKAMCSLQTDVPGADIGMIKIRELHDFKKHPSQSGKPLCTGISLWAVPKLARGRCPLEPWPPML